MKLRIQKKMAGKFVSMSAVKSILSDDSYKVLEGAYRILKYESNKQVAKKIINIILKLTSKIVIILKNQLLNDEENSAIEEFAIHEKLLLKTFISFIEVEYSYDSCYLIEKINHMKVIIVKILERHSKPKTMDKIDFVFNELTVKARLDNIFGLNVSEKISKQRLETLEYVKKLI